MESAAPSLVDQVIAAFGGLSATARALGHKHVTTVDGWKRKRRIPPWRRSEIIAAAEQKGVQLPTEFLEPPANEAAA